ncbi:hypothetical protein E2C01_047218 [Portunus trituberculatus]|uniref:Uncharacterized protein n=1 Tax=Portunus trituberculatus TaxID=210409 RepID=A0A5B7G6V5_PORTR|nr:hypothetical protein [Portunus trituberculatus]
MMTPNPALESSSGEGTRNVPRLDCSLSDPSLYAKHIAEVTVSGMEVYVAESFSQPKPSTPRFNLACSHAIHNREVAHKRYKSLPPPESHALYISARNHAHCNKAQNTDDASRVQTCGQSQKHLMQLVQLQQAQPHNKAVFLTQWWRCSSSMFFVPPCPLEQVDNLALL